MLGRRGCRRHRAGPAVTSAERPEPRPLRSADGQSAHRVRRRRGVTGHGSTALMTNDMLVRSEENPSPKYLAARSRIAMSGCDWPGWLCAVRPLAAGQAHTHSAQQFYFFGLRSSSTALGRPSDLSNSAKSQICTRSPLRIRVLPSGVNRGMAPQRAGERKRPTSLAFAMSQISRLSENVWAETSNLPSGDTAK